MVKAQGIRVGRKPLSEKQLSGRGFLSRAGTPSLPIRSLAGFPADAGRCYSKLYHPLLDRGIYLAPSAFEVSFLSAAHDSNSVGQLAAGLRDLMRDL